MVENKLPTWPHEWKIDQSKKEFNSITSPKKAEIAEIFQDVHKMKFHAEEIELSPRANFDEAVEMLLQKKVEGKNCFINFNWTKIYTADTQDVDDAYIQYMWMTKAEKEEGRRKYQEEMKMSEEWMKKREEWYIQKISDSREWLEEVKITKESVVAGLKFIAEHPDMEQDQLIDELIKLGCNFTFDDIKKQFPKEVKVFPGMKEGYLWCGASVIVNSMVSEYWRSYAKDRFLSVDDDTSAYAFIRKATGNKSYTKEYVDSLKKKTL